jgi:hypothetical protein
MGFEALETSFGVVETGFKAGYGWWDLRCSRSGLA